MYPRGEAVKSEQIWAEAGLDIALWVNGQVDDYGRLIKRGSRAQRPASYRPSRSFAQLHQMDFLIAMPRRQRLLMFDRAGINETPARF